MSGKSESLEMLRALNELTQGFKETAPLFREVLSLMRKATSGTEAMGYFEAADKIDHASVDEKDIMLLLGIQFLAQILDVIAADQALKDVFKERFSASELIQGL